MVTPFLLVSVVSSASDTQHPGRCFNLPERLGAIARFSPASTTAAGIDQA